MVERCIYILLLHREPLHVSALDNGLLQVVHESLSKQLYKHIYIYGLLMGGGVKWARDLVPTLPPLPHISSTYIYIYVCVCVCMCVCLYNCLLSDSCTT